MKTKMENYMTMARNVAEIVRRHEREWEVLPKFIQYVSDLNILLGSSQGHQVAAMLTTTGITVDKNLAAEHAIDMCVQLSKRAIAYAMDMNNHELEKKLRTSKHELLHGHQVVVLQKLEEVKAVLTEQLPALMGYGVQQQDMDQFELVIREYAAMLEQPRRQIVERKSHNEMAAENVPAIRRVLHKMDNLINYFEPAQWVLDYNNARITIAVGSRKTVAPKKEDKGTC